MLEAAVVLRYGEYYLRVLQEAPADNSARRTEFAERAAFCLRLAVGALSALDRTFAAGDAVFSGTPTCPAVRWSRGTHLRWLGWMPLVEYMARWPVQAARLLHLLHDTVPSLTHTPQAEPVRASLAYVCVTACSLSLVLRWSLVVVAFAVFTRQRYRYSYENLTVGAHGRIVR